MTQIVALSLLAVVGAFQACGAGHLGQTELASKRNGFDYGPDYAQGAGGVMIEVEETKTAAVNYSEQVLTSLVSVSGIGQASARTLNVYRNEKSKIAESGKAESVNAPMWIAITNLSGEICWDLVQQEKALAADQRRIFRQINFASGPQNISDAAKDDVIRRLARSAWARNENDEERGLIKASLSEAFQGKTANVETDRAMLFTCAAVMAALDTHDR